MTRVYSKALDQEIEVDRIIGVIKGAQPGPTVLMTGGIHGNEPSGVFALHKVLQYLKSNNINVKGNFYAISGNLWALEKGERYKEQDLNRLWIKDNLNSFASKQPTSEDESQQKEIYTLFKEIMASEVGPFYFMDLHTTSSETIPFLTVNDSLLNRQFTQQYPVPIILGIEEYLDGPLLSYINELGFVAFGYEGGQHDDLTSIENHVAFIMLSLVFAGSIEKRDIDYQHYYDFLAKNTVDSRDIYEVIYQHLIDENQYFKMRPGFFNFQLIRQNSILADNGQSEIRAPYSGRIFMPLYQDKGTDGFFIIRTIPDKFMRLSAFLRKIRADRILPILPGVKWIDEQRETLLVDRRIARFMAKQLFHLLGYRSKRKDKSHYIMKNREAVARTEEYKEAIWLN